MHGEISNTQSLAEMERSDILLLFDTPGRRIGVPAKLYEYIGSGRSILAMAETDGDTAWVLRQSDSNYRFANPNESGSILRCMNELIEAIENGHSVIDFNPRMQAFTRDNLTRQLASVLDECTDNRSI